MSKGYLVPVTVKVCADGSKGHGVFATAPVTKGTLLWRPSEVKAVPAAKVTSSLAAMPREEASVSPDDRLLSCKSALELIQAECRSSFASPLSLPSTQEPSVSIGLTMAASRTTAVHPM